MFLNVFPGNQKHFNGVIGFERPPRGFCDDLEPLAPMHVRPMADYLKLPNNGRFGRGATIPIIHFDVDHKYRFTTSGWGRWDNDKSYREYVRWYDQAPNKFPAVIAASYFDIMFDAPKEDGCAGVRLRNKNGEPLYIGAKYFPNHERFIYATVSFVVASGPDVVRFSDWQPLLIPAEQVLPYLSDPAMVIQSNQPKDSLRVETLRAELAEEKPALLRIYDHFYDVDSTAST